jgi:hypothetical protein
MSRVPCPAPGTVIAIVALFVALGGTGYAVITSGVPDSARG